MGVLSMIYPLENTGKSGDVKGNLLSWEVTLKLDLLTDGP